MKYHLSESQRWGLILLGWSVGLWTCLAVLCLWLFNWLIQTEHLLWTIWMISGLAGGLFAASTGLNRPANPMQAWLYAGLPLSVGLAVWLAASGITSLGFLLVALWGVITYRQRLQRYAGIEPVWILRVRDAVNWMTAAAILESIPLLVALALLFTPEHYNFAGEVYIIGFLWMTLTGILVGFGHTFYNEAGLSAGLRLPALWVVFIPWSLALGGWITEMATFPKDKENMISVWGLVAGIILSALAALQNRKQILNIVSSQLGKVVVQANPMTEAAPMRKDMAPALFRRNPPETQSQNDVAQGNRGENTTSDDKEQARTL